ncbi:MAG: type II secretion system F family protein [Minisyncoccia bacterium]|jgi:type IV pilus assembly protein PilC
MRFKGCFNRKGRLALLERLEMYISSGLPIACSLSLAGEASPKRQRESLDKVRQAVESGQALSTVLASEVRLPPAVVGLIACGESSGNLAETLKIGHALLEREDEIIKKCLSAMTYPSVIGLAAVSLALGLILVIMPQIIPLLAGLHRDLPMVTKIVMAMSRALMSYWPYLAAVSILLPALFVAAYRRNRTVRALTHLCAIHVPVVGGIMSRYALALFFQSFGALVESGMPSGAAYGKAASSIGLIPLRRSFEEKTRTIMRGGPIHEVFKENVPPYVAPLVAAGEASGNLGRSLLRTAYLLDRELDHGLKRLTALIEPVMMIGVGSIVGSIALSIMMPIYDISKTLQR